MSFWTDAAVLGGAGIPSVLYGPGGAGLHSTEEYVTLDDVVLCRDALATLPPADRDRLLSEASLYASSRLAEVEAADRCPLDPYAGARRIRVCHVAEGGSAVATPRLEDVAVDRRGRGVHDPRAASRRRVPEEIIEE